jgi:Holliday junction resolvase
MGVKTRGNLVTNILEKYKDTENLYIENYALIAYRDINKLKENSLIIKEADIGTKFEEITKKIFSKLGFDVDEKIRKTINNAKNKIDIIINLDNNELILVECKTIKESGYNKFASVSRQLRSYINLAKAKNFRVIKSLLIAPEFSEDFEKECREDFELNLSLITAETLVNILNGFKDTKHKQLPYQLLMKDVLIKEDWILKAINK